MFNPKNNECSSRIIASIQSIASECQMCVCEAGAGAGATLIKITLYELKFPINGEILLTANK